MTSQSIPGSKFAVWKRLQGMKAAGKKIVSAALYTALEARLFAPYLDFILVGDSLAMTVYGHGTTQAATLEMMVAHTADVVRWAGQTPVVMDLPESCYHTTADAMTVSRYAMARTGCAAVKLEGGAEKGYMIEYLTWAGIPVIGHIGLMPSHFGKNDPFAIERNEERLRRDALAVQASGAVAIVIEGAEEGAAGRVARVLTIPSIGIGASPDCAGQILVLYDLLGLRTTSKIPRFVRLFKQPGMTAAQAVKAYRDAVRDGSFPDREKECYHPRAPKPEGSVYGAG